MIIPSKDLKTGEICVPWMKEGEQVLNFRSPFLNHNGMIHSTNKYVEDMYAPSGKELQGVIIVNDEDYSRIVNRTLAEAKAIKPNIILPDIPNKLNKLSVDERISLTDQFNTILEEAGVKLRIPYESDCERMAADFDGDCMGVAEATRYPNFTKEVINKSQPQNLFKPTRKEDKLSFPEGTDFETIAIHQSDGISVGSINNSVTAFEALLSEQEIYETYGTPALKRELAQQLITKAQQLLKQEKNAKNIIPIPEFLRPNFEYIASFDKNKVFKNKQTQGHFDNNKSLSQEQLQEVFDTQRNIYRKMIEEGCYQNQIAVDLFKSARQPDKDSITNLTKLLYRQVDYFKKKKDFQTYRQGILETKGFSPTELTASLVNVEFQENQLTASPPVQFKHLFPSNYTPQQALEVKQVKADYDAAYNIASAYNRKQKFENDTHLKITTKSGKNIEVVNYKRFVDHSEVNNLSRQPLNLRIIDNTNRKTKNNHRLITQYLDGDGKWNNLGFVCELSREKHGLKAGLNSSEAKLKVAQSLGKKEVQLLFNQANAIALDWRKKLEETKTPDELNQYTNATWHLCHNHTLDTTNNFVYSAFGDKIIEQTAQPKLQFDNFLVGQLKKYNEVPESLWKSDQFLDLQIQEVDGDKMWQVFNPETEDYQSFGVASYKEFQLPIGTKVKGQIKGDLFTTARLDIDNPLLKDTEIVIGNMTKYPTVGHEFRNESATIVLSEQQNVPPQPLIKLNGKKLGQLDSNAVELFKQYNRFRDQLTFNVSLTSYGEGNGKEIIATTEQGTSFKIEKSHFLADKDLKDTQFNGEQVTVTLSLETPKKKAMVANIKQADGSLLPIGEFTTNQKASKLALSKVGLFKEGATFQAKINSRVTAASIEIKPDSLEYPALGKWQGISQNTTEIELEPTAKRFIETITTQPTLLHRFEQQWQDKGQIETLPTLGLSVDLNRVAATKEFLEKYHIPYKLIPLDDKSVQLESERSYGVFTMIESDVPTNIRQWMEQASKGIFDANNSDENALSSYHKKLISILPLSNNQQQERLQNSKAVYHTVETTKVNKRGSPPSENGEHNQTENSVKITANSDNKQKDKISEYISFNDIPSEPEIDEIDKLMEQQIKTDLVAPIAAQFLKVQDPSNSPTRHYQGKEITIDYDGHHLTIKNNQDNSIKMKARFVGVNPASKKSQWLSELPENSPGLRDADVQKWTSEAVKNYIKQKQVEQENNHSVCLSK
ncbi:hypothetical protein CWATWH0003_B238 [Crocosphaera watsonii WH 0003]|nr:hypothetical protein CWATWH0003_B238 [Crocosphaera watsonii WH 0003]